MVLTEIKEVTSRDLQKIVALEHQIFKKDAFSKKLIQQLINNNTFFLKMENGRIKKNLIGFIIVIRDSKNKANIINFLIKTQYQNKGYGS
jgi:ribosomal protein S18 acetylase RimI-like enzyme